MAKNNIINSKNILGGIEYIVKIETDYAILYKTGELAKLNILKSHVFKLYISPTGEFLDYPKPHNPNDTAKINIKRIEDYGLEGFENSFLEEKEKSYSIDTGKVEIHFNKTNGTMAIYDKRTKRQVLKESQPLSYANNETVQTLHQHKDEYFFGGGMQNGRFTHKGEIIDIVNTNNWIDGGISSPCPFYWSSRGYGVLRNTWQPGIYDFGSKFDNSITTGHVESHFDAFFFINEKPKDILNDYYELTGHPISMPEYAFYEAHLNAFNRDYWVKVTAETQGAILFENGFYYKSYKPNEIGDKHGILESLNGEKNNYQFSARAMVDRYKKHDMPLGWFIPNDGYGSGYGQTDSLYGDIENLKEFADYARANGVEVALWTESNLLPEDPTHPKKGERDLSKEVSVAGVVALKCDVAWIGSGYSFGLSAVENAADIFEKAAKHGVRPLIIMVDGWAGTQRYAGIWSGDQTGGQWEYIRFHIPTYIGTGLSGQPIVGADMDGIYGGGESREVNIRDYQWKTFTPLQLNMDGWGNIPKTPFSFDDEATAINKAYLKLKSMFMPYNYTISHESIHGLPMIRAMFLEFPEEKLAFTNDSKYQFMWGPSILVAPVYNNEKIEEDSARNGLYLPDTKQVWIDLFTGEKYQGGKIYNCIMTPLWKLPVFVRDGAVIPMTNPNNNPKEIKRNHRIFTLYPNGKTSFTVYEDDGISSDYLRKQFATTEITVIGPKSQERDKLQIIIDKTKGCYKNMVKERTTILQVMTSKNINEIKTAINSDIFQITKASTEEEFEQQEDVFYIKDDFVLNPYLSDFGGSKLHQKFLLIKIKKLDVTKSHIHLKMEYENKGDIFGRNKNVLKTLDTPHLKHNEERTTATSIVLNWDSNTNLDYYEIERDGMIFSNIKGTEATFDGFKIETTHSFRIRAVSPEGVSIWSDHIDATTKEDPFKNIIKNVKVQCNLPCQPCQEIRYLTEGELRQIWHTEWGQNGKADSEKLKLNFDLGDVYEIDKVEYIPREDAGNGTFLEIQYRISADDRNWSHLSDVISFDHDTAPKIIRFDGERFRFMEMIVLKSIGRYGSGKKMHFYKKVILDNI